MSDQRAKLISPPDNDHHNSFSLWTNLLFLVPAVVALLKSQYIHSLQLVFMTGASFFMHYKFKEEVWGMTNIQRFLWDNFASLLSMYFAVSYVLSSGHINPMATLTCVHALVFVCSAMVAKKTWGGPLNYAGMGCCLALALTQLDIELYEFQWVQVAAVVSIALGLLNLYALHKWWSHGMWHFCAATCFTLAYLNRCDSDEWLF